MSCITDVSYSVLLNGAPTPFFLAERGLRQGCPFSPLLFLLMMEGLSSLIGAEHRRGKIMGIKIMENCFLSHLLFVDDVLIFLNDNIGDTLALQYVFDLFQKATGMIINVRKSTLTAVGCSQLEVQFTLSHFPFTSHPAEISRLPAETFGLQNCRLDLAHRKGGKEAKYLLQQVSISGRKTHSHKSCAESDTGILDVSDLDSKGNSS